MAEPSTITNPSRRAMLAGIPAAAIGVGAVLPAFPALAGPSEMECAYRAWLPLRKVALDAYAIESPLVQAFNESYRDKPDVLRWHPTDDVGHETWPLPGEPGKYRLYVDSDEDSLATLRSIAAGNEISKFGDPDKKRARAKAILHGFEALEAKAEEVKCAIGLDKAEEAANIACEAEYQAEQRLLSTPILSFRDLACRAAVAKSNSYNDADEVELLLDHLIELSGINT